MWMELDEDHVKWWALMLESSGSATGDIPICFYTDVKWFLF